MPKILAEPKLINTFANMKDEDRYIRNTLRAHRMAFIIAAAFAALFYLLDKLGIV